MRFHGLTQRQSRYRGAGRGRGPGGSAEGRQPHALRQKQEAPARYMRLQRPPKGVRQEVCPLPPTRGRGKTAGGLTRSSAPALCLSSPVRQQPLLPTQHLPQLGEAPAPQAGAGAAARRCHAAPPRLSPGQPPGPDAAGAASAASPEAAILPEATARRQGPPLVGTRRPTRPLPEAGGAAPPRFTAPPPGGQGSAGETTPSKGGPGGDSQSAEAAGAISPQALGTRFGTYIQRKPTTRSDVGSPSARAVVAYCGGEDAPASRRGGPGSMALRPQRCGGGGGALSVRPCVTPPWRQE